uniref:Uncharacterized protein n=1 Tax=Nyssomyia neivai TaxID=330878 RepID=A0A1L8DCU3_9DIPT
MRTKNFLIILCCVIATSLVLIILGPTGQQNQSIKDIIDGTHQQFKELKEQLRVSDEKKLDIDPKYLALLGFTQTIYNGTKTNFSIVTYALKGQAASLILLAQNMALRLPNEPLLIYDLGLSEDDSRAVSGFCNSSKCSVIPYDLTVYPSYVSDEDMHAFRPLVIKDALTRAHTVLFIENSVRVRGGSRDVRDLMRIVSMGGSGVLGWVTRQAVSARTHPKMFEYFQVTKESFLFLPMVEMDVVFFIDTPAVNEKILLPWIKCTLTPECIHPIGAQSGGCKFNKKPQYRYSGCHGYDASAFNIVLGLTFGFDEKKYSIVEQNLFYMETLEQATKILENKRRNISDTSEHPFTEE